MTKIVTDEVSEFLEKNPQEICEGASDTKPGNDPKPGTTEPTTESTNPGNDPKPGDDTKPGADEPATEPTTPGNYTKPADTVGPAASDNKPGSSATTNGGNKTVNGADTSHDGVQTVLEGATETGGLATTGAVGLIALGVSVLLVGAGVGLAAHRRK